MGQKKGEISKLTDEIVSTLKEAVLILDSDLRVIYANKQFYDQFNTTPEGIEGIKIYEFVNRQFDIPQLHEMLSEVLTKKKDILDYEVSKEFSNSWQKTFLLNAKQIIRQENSDRLILLTIEDVTEEKKLLEYVIQAGKLSAIGQLCAGIAHGLGSPLTGIQNLLYVYFEQEKKGTEKYKELKLMLEACDYMSGVIKEVTYFAGRGQEQFSKISLSDVVESTLLFTERQLSANNIQVIRDFPKDLDKVNGRKSDLQHVFLNILINAKEAMRNGGKIIVRGRSSGGKVTLEILDSGVGIPKQNLSKIFTPFFTTKSGAGGPDWVCLLHMA